MYLKIRANDIDLKWLLIFILKMFSNRIFSMPEFNLVLLELQNKAKCFTKKMWVSLNTIQYCTEQKSE